MKIQFVVTHLLGTGHLARMINLARAFEKAGHETVIVSGGLPVPHFDMSGLTCLQLPPLRSDGVDFSRLMTQDGALASETFRAERQDLLLKWTSEIAPDVLITELFPFGRRTLRHEFTALMSHARTLPAAPLILSSIRDILAPPRRPRQSKFAEDMLLTHYDGVLVHSDGEIAPLDLSWPVAPTYRTMLHYTGFVAPPPAGTHPEALGQDEVLVSAGGGDIGITLFECAKEAALQDPDRSWCFLIGGENAARHIEALRRDAPAHVRIEAARPDFRQMLHHAQASISMCGYNTTLDILQSGCPAVFVPFDAGDEVEQGIRADALTQLNQIEVVRTADLNPRALLDALDRTLQGPIRPPRPDMDGAGHTVTCVETLVQNRG